MFHDLSAASAADCIGHYLPNMPLGSLLVVGVFSTDTEALCWLTDPMRLEAVTNANEDAAQLESAASSDDGWFAVYNPSLSSSFDARKPGAERALSLLSPRGAGVSVVCRVATAAAALSWLACRQPRDLLEVLGSEEEVSEPHLVATSYDADPVEAFAGHQDGPDGLQPPPTSSLVTRGAGTQRLASSCCAVEGKDGSSPAKRRKVGAANSWAMVPTAPPVSCASGRAPTDVYGMERGESVVKSSKPQLVTAGGPPPALNPAYTTRDQAETVFSNSDMHVLLRQFSTVYNQLYGTAPEAGAGVEARSCTGGLSESVPCDPNPSAGVVVSTAPASAAAGGAATNKGPSSLPASESNAGPSAAPPSTSSRPTSTAYPRGTPSRAAAPAPKMHDRDVELGPLSLLASTGNYDALCDRMAQLLKSTFVSGGPGVGKTFFLRKYNALLRTMLPDDGAVVVCAPTGSAAQTAKGDTYHSIFGFGMGYTPSSPSAVVEAARLLNTKRYAPIRRRLARVRVLFLDEISMIPANRLDIMWQLLVQSRRTTDRECVLYAFGDFMQLRPHDGDMAYHAVCWSLLFSNYFLDLRRVHRQCDPHFIEAIRDARFGLLSPALLGLFAERTVSADEYRSVEVNVLHLMPTHEEVIAHNVKCFKRLCPAGQPPPFVCQDRAALPNDRDTAAAVVDPTAVLKPAVQAALAECVAPCVVPHCKGARVMYTSNAKKQLGLCHGSMGYICDYLPSGTPVVHFVDTPLPDGVRLNSLGVRGAGDTWIEVECPMIEFEAPLLSKPGLIAVRKQVPFVMGWAITIHRSQSLTLHEAVVDLRRSFEAGMVHAAVSRVTDKTKLYVKSFSPGRLYADNDAKRRYLSVWHRL